MSLVGIVQYIRLLVLTNTYLLLKHHANKLFSVIKTPSFPSKSSSLTSTGFRSQIIIIMIMMIIIIIIMIKAIKCDKQHDRVLQQGEEAVPWQRKQKDRSVKKPLLKELAPN